MRLNDEAPRGLLRLLLRAPLALYRLRLGWLLGRRFVYVAHRGRRTGRRRETVLEVVRYDRERREVFVVSGWGPRADWCRNLAVSPPIEVRVGGARFPSPRCRWLDPAETVLLIESYRDAHPRAWRRIARMFGFPADPSGLAAVAERIPAVAFRPADEAHDPSHGP